MTNEDTIKEVIVKMKDDKDNLFQIMAMEDPYLYQFVYGMYQLPSVDKDVMLGVCVGIYHMLRNKNSE